MKKIMIVDDVEISNFIMKKMISKVPGDFDIYAFTLPGKAIDSVEAINPDLIFLDVNMPEINGWQFLEMMKERRYGHDVFILTSSTSELDLHQSRQYENVRHFLVKPISLHSITGILQDVCMDTYVVQ